MSNYAHDLSNIVLKMKMAGQDFVWSAIPILINIHQVSCDFQTDMPKLIDSLLNTQNQRRC